MRDAKFLVIPMEKLEKKRLRKKKVREYIKWWKRNSLKNKSLIELKSILFNVETDLKILALGNRIPYRKISKLSLLMEIVLDCIRIRERIERKLKL